MHTQLKRLVLLAALHMTTGIALGQDVGSVPQLLGSSPGTVITLPPGGGTSIPLTDTQGFSEGAVLDVSSVPAGELPGFGELTAESTPTGDSLRRDNVARDRIGANIFGGVQLCEDDDSDGVCNPEDYCADTPPQSIVLPSGCHLSRNAPLELVGVFFDFNGSSLRPESYEILDRVVALLVQQDTVVAEIGGHTDSRGDPDKNLQLSRDRAKAVYDYLVRRGIEPYRLTYKGYGSSQPVAPNQRVNGEDNADGRARNRRVDMRVVNDLATLQK